MAWYLVDGAELESATTGLNSYRALPTELPIQKSVRSSFAYLLASEVTGRINLDPHRKRLKKL